MDRTSPMFRMMVGLATILTLMVIVVLVSPQSKEKIEVEKGSIGIVSRPTYLYEKGSENAKVIKELPKGTRLVILSVNLFMYQVELDNGDKAWVPVEDLEVTPPAK